VSALRIRYQTIEFENTDIHVRTLRDKQQYCDDNGVAEKLEFLQPHGPFLELYGIRAWFWPI